MKNFNPSQVHAAAVAAMAADTVRNGGVVDRTGDAVAVLPHTRNLLIGGLPAAAFVNPDTGIHQLRTIHPETGQIKIVGAMTEAELDNFVEKHGIFYTIPNGFRGYET